MRHLFAASFFPVDVHRIPQIPLHVEAIEDFVAWQHTRTGTFSMRSAYHVEFEHQLGQHLNWTSPSSASLNGVWKDLWKLRLPGKIKHFGWKVLKGVLPCYGVLANRHIPLIPQCPVCSTGLEDIQHCLFTCTGARTIWTKLGLSQEIELVV